MSTSLQSIMQARFFELIHKRCGYFDGSLYTYSKNGELKKYKKEDSPKLDFLIVSRKFYTEAQKYYPIDNKKDLGKVLGLEYPKSDSYAVKYEKAPNGEGFNVNTWKFDDALPESWFKVPESYLFSEQLKEGEACEDSSKDIFIGKLNSITYSAIRSPLVSTLSAFVYSVGLSNSTVNQKVLLNASAFSFLKSAMVHKLWPFFVPPNTQQRVSLIKSISIPFFGVLGIYFAFSSLFLVSQQYLLEQEIASKQKRLSEALTVQNRIDEGLVEVNKIKNVLNDTNSLSPMWLVIAEISDQVKFSNIRVVNGRYVIRGETENATSLLERISNNTFSLDAKFDYPTRKRKNEDVFVISFVINSEELTRRFGVNRGESNGST